MGQVIEEAQIVLTNLFRRLGYDNVTFNLSPEAAPRSKLRLRAIKI